MKSKIWTALALFLMQPAFAEMQKCEDGKAGIYPCSNIDLMASMDLTKKGTHSASGNDIWGWTDPLTQHEIAIVGGDSKTSFIDITDALNPVYLGDLKTHTYKSIWRDIKVYKDHAYIVSEAYSHGLQVFNLAQLRDLKASDLPVQFQATAQYDRFGSAHNIVINEDSGYAYAVGSSTCDKGMHVVNIQDPAHPVFSTCIDRSIFDDVQKHGEDYTHDAQCVIYHGPDAAFVGREICIASNADTVNIVDVTDKANAKQISVKDYSGVGYTHQGWMTEDHRYFILGDELDEMNSGHKTRTIIWDIQSLENPVVHFEFFHETSSIDHNLYVLGQKVYMSNYTAGLQILDLTHIADKELTRVGYFDTHPSDDAAQFEGAWSVYPYFASGNVVISNINGLFFVVKPH